MQVHPSAPGLPFSRHTAATPWRDAVQALTEEDNQPALTLLKMLTFVKADLTIPNLGLSASSEVPGRFSRLRGLATKAEFDDAMATLQRHKLVSKDEETPARSIDASLQTAIYAPMTLNEKQHVFNESAYSWSRLFRCDLTPSGFDEQLRVIWRRTYPHVLSLLTRFDQSDLSASEHSAMLAVNAAR